MMLIADSGSTKADWMLIENGRVTAEILTAGINPLFHEEETILDELRKSEELATIREKVSRVYFYGAGCSGEKQKHVLQQVFHKFFSNAGVFVDNDLTAAVLATCDQQPGICCILGTGCNSCYFDGKQIQKNNFGLGYVLGDEGSGTYLGKKILTSYLYNRLPEDLWTEFRNAHTVTKEILIEHVYRKPFPNSWMASFVPFLVERKKHLWVKKIVFDGFCEFLDLYVCNYNDYRKLPVHFVGSVAYQFEDILREAGAKKEVTIQKVLRSPLYGLIDHLIGRGIKE